MQEYIFILMQFAIFYNDIQQANLAVYQYPSPLFLSMDIINKYPLSKHCPALQGRGDNEPHTFGL
jgi:hypothetical protein